MATKRDRLVKAAGRLHAAVKAGDKAAIGSVINGDVQRGRYVRGLAELMGEPAKMTPALLALYRLFDHDNQESDPGFWRERMLATIDAAQRAVVVLHYYLDLTLPETADALGIPVGTAKSRLNRALDRMRITVVDETELSAVATARERFA